VCGEAERASASLPPAPSRDPRDALDHVPQTSGIDRMFVERLTVVG
jgi:hypothetical protein